MKKLNQYRPSSFSILIIFVLLMIIGVSVLPLLNVQLTPSRSLPELSVSYRWPDAPARFYPLYMLAKLYDETGQYEKAEAMAKKVMKKEIKIESTAIKEIKEEMRKIIEKSEAEILNEGKIHTDKNLGPIYKGTKEGAYRSVVLTAKFMLQKW